MVAYLLVQIGTVTVYAVEVGKTVLPGTEKGVSDCKTVMNYVNTHSGAVKKFFTNADNEDFGFDTGAGGVADENDILGCGIKTGDIKLWMIPYYIRYVLEFIIQISGLVAVGGIMYGGYLYFHPAFLYESLWLFGVALILFFLLTRWARREPFIEGRVFFLFLALGGIGRFGIEFLRIDAMPYLFGVRLQQLVSALIFALWIFGMLWVRRKRNLPSAATGTQ